jgi:uncharacterized membrane protein
MQHKNRERLAALSLGMGIGGCLLALIFPVAILLAAIPAIICGHKARRRIREGRGELQGRNMATAGLVLGYLAVTGYLLATVYLLVLVGELKKALP